MCSGARNYRCWNGATFDGADAADRLIRADVARVETLPGFEETFLRRVQELA
jgi:hypothetical protein